MDFIFVCCNTQKVFRTTNFELINNNGVKTDSAGNKYLDAEVILTDTCPFCGIKHIYHVNELSCPFNG
jgi:hypothetical protein